MAQTIPCYDIFELVLSGPQGGNPFTEVSFSARFQHRNRLLEPEGFYDGEGRYIIRLMPDEQGEWRYVTKSSVPELNGVEGSFECTAARQGIHGPVQVANTYHFAYADGRRHFSFGTTCYAWVHQPPSFRNKL